MPDDRAEIRAIRYPWPDPPPPGTATEVADGVLWMRLPLPMALDHVNVYALADDAGWTLIDTGLAWSRGRAAWEALLAGPLAGRPVHRVIVTHHHPDHVGLAAGFVRAGADLLMPRTGYLLARMLTLDVQDRIAPEAEAFYVRAGMSRTELDRRRADRPFNFSDCVELLPTGHHRIAEGDVLDFGGRRWDVRMGDGHAPEHATFWARDEPLVIGGDQLLPSISPNLGVHPTEPEADPVSDWLAACERLAPHAREDQLVLPGHKLPFKGLPARLEQLVENHHGAIARLIAYLDQPRRGGECFQPLFRREIGTAEYGLALAETIGYLNHVTARGLAHRWQSDDDGAWLWQAA